MEMDPESFLSATAEIAHVADRINKMIEYFQKQDSLSETVVPETLRTNDGRILPQSMIDAAAGEMARRV